MIFRDTLLSILVFVNENYCFCAYFTELYLFFWLLVVPLSIFIAKPVVFSVYKHRMREYLKRRALISVAFKDNT